MEINVLENLNHCKGTLRLVNRLRQRLGLARVKRKRIDRRSGKKAINPFIRDSIEEKNFLHSDDEENIDGKSRVRVASRWVHPARHAGQEKRD